MNDDSAPQKHGSFNHDASVIGSEPRNWVPQSQSNWTEERVAFLKEHWGHRDWSASKIGAALGVTRNAVIGKAGRVGLRLPQSTVDMLRAKRNRDFTNKGRIYATKNGDGLKAYKIKSRGRELKMWQEIEATDLPPDQADNPLTFTELGDHDCRWPCSGEGWQTTFCGGIAVPSHPYCARHCRMAYQAPRSRISRAEFESEARRRKAAAA